MNNLKEVPEKFRWKQMRLWLGAMRTAIHTIRPIQGDKITISEHIDQGTIINADQTKDAADCAPTTPPETGTWIWGSVEGVCQWIDTTTCP
jgi:hypothetical protein